MKIDNEVKNLEATIKRLKEETYQVTKRLAEAETKATDERFYATIAKAIDSTETKARQVVEGMKDAGFVLIKGHDYYVIQEVVLHGPQTVIEKTFKIIVDLEE